MARRRKSSTAEDLMDLVALLPWWAGVVLALVSYWVLHAIATRPLPAAQSAQQIGQLATTAIWQGLATGGQYLLPMICLFGAVMSAVRRQRRRALFDTTSASNSADALQDMSWQQFELLVGEGFRRRGYAVKEVGGGGADGGVDLILTKAGEKSFVQCKQWKAFKVSVSTVRELYGVMAAHGAAGGFVVTSGRFTQEATAFANGRNIRLIDGAALMQLLREARSKTEASPSLSDAPVLHGMAASPRSNESAGIAQVMAPAGSANPHCPKCDKPMVRRVAKRGVTAGKAFWGCSDFAAGCRGTREI
ncbi:Restriction endonuclease [compost metagenome]|uniref:restriction endonuclease n=1 Tax=Variovorax boronicumulans TaxID=436515 RepID=UPI000BB2F916|nr:restriction endonuclease [Variovorax boronicumulans]PBI85240.1 Restriction endonuclease [Variovorax boronicumulans]